jgi:hypothetical protein
MQSDATHGVVVMSLRNEREVLVLQTSEGEVEIDLSVVSKVRNRVVVRAPRSISIARRARVEVTP